MVFVVDRMVMEVVETSDHNDEETEEDDSLSWFLELVKFSVFTISRRWWEGDDRRW